jgi:ABC-type amino acid transport substrate-binding protein
LNVRIFRLAAPLLSALIVAAIRVTVAAVCVTVAAAGAQAQTSVLDKVKQDRVLKVCYGANPPDSFKDPKTGEWTGPMVDIVNELAKWIKVRVEPVEVGWDVAVLSLQQGTCDLFGTGLIYNAPRALEVSFVKPFLAKGINVVVAKSSTKPLAKPADLNNENVTIAVVLGAREHETVQRLFPKAKILAIKAQTPLQVIDLVKRGDADVAALPALQIHYWLQIPENAEWAREGLPGQDFGAATLAWAIRYGDPNWWSFLNAYVDWVEATKLSTTLYDSYMARTNPFMPAK